LARESDAALDAGEYRAAIEKCTEALALAPNYAGALFSRGTVFTTYLRDRWYVLNPERRLALAGAAFRDGARSAELWPASNPARLNYYAAVIYLARARSAPDICKEALAGLDALLKRGWPYTPLTDYERAFRFNVRAQAHQFLGKLKEAEDDYARSIHANPGTPLWYQMRAQFWEQTGRADLAEKDWSQAEQLERGIDKSPVKPAAQPESRLPEIPRANGDIFDSDKSPRDTRSSPN
jgi:tetratricopeptide (TPR) repeat protein